MVVLRVLFKWLPGQGEVTLLVIYKLFILHELHCIFLLNSRKPCLLKSLQDLRLCEIVWCFTSLLYHIILYYRDIVKHRLTDWWVISVISWTHFKQFNETLHRKKKNRLQKLVRRAHHKIQQEMSWLIFRGKIFFSFRKSKIGKLVFWTSYWTGQEYANIIDRWYHIRHTIWQISLLIVLGRYNFNLSFSKKENFNM